MEEEDLIDMLEKRLAEIEQNVSNIENILKEESKNTNVDYSLLSRNLKKDIQKIKNTLNSFRED